MYMHQSHMIVLLVVMVAKLLSYWIWSPLTVHRIRFVSHLCGRYVVIMQIYVALLWAVLSLLSTKNMVLVSTSISGLHPCASQAFFRTFSLSHFCPSLLLSSDASSDDLHVSSVMAVPVNYNQGSVYMLGMGDWEICWTVYLYLGGDLIIGLASA